MAVSLTSPTPSARTAARRLHPAEEKTRHLPQRIEARQPGITGSPLKWQAKNQRSGFTSSSATTSPLPYLPPLSSDPDDTVEHQHGRQRELRVAGAEQVALGALDQVLEGVTLLFLAHAHRPGQAK
jgi:hypothetical protein